MSDATSTTAIPWPVYDQLLFLLPEGRRELLTDLRVRAFCRAAIDQAKASVSEQDVLLSVAVRYRHSIGTNSQTSDARASDVTGTPPSEYDSHRVRIIVQALLEERQVAADEQAKRGGSQR